MQMQNCRCGHYGVQFILLPTECRGDKHAQHQARILHLDPDLASADRRIENRKKIADRALEHATGIRAKRYLRGVADVNTGQIVLIHVADNPYVGEIGDGERISSQALHSAGICNLLVSDHAGNRRRDVHYSRRMIDAAAK